MRNGFKRAAAIMLTVIMLLALLPASLASEVSDPVIPGLQDGGELWLRLAEEQADEDELNETETKQSLYTQLMACETLEEMLDLLDEQVEPSTLMTEEEVRALAAYINGKEWPEAFAEEKILSIFTILTGNGNYDDLIVDYASRTTTFTPTISNAEVIYVHYTNNTDVNSITFQTVNGTFNSNYNDNYDNYWVFFVKPNDNYLLTGLGADGNSDMYLTDASSFGNISGYPNIAALAKKAKDMGYVAMFGYSRSKGTNLGNNISFTVNCQSPDIEVEAESNKTDNVVPGDELTFTVTITPGHTTSGKDKVEKVSIESITVNGENVAYRDFKDNGDGTYTVTVDYKATADDCASGSVKLEVTASVEYSGTPTLSDTSGDTGSVNTNATITKSAEVTCWIAPKNAVTYTHTYEIPDGITITEYPKAITGNPVDVKEYYTNELVTVDTTYPQMGSVVDTVNGGIWTFDGWYLDDKKVTTATMTDEGLTFTGVWKFTPQTYTVTVTKTVSGNMGDKSKEFNFTYQIGNDTVEFALQDGREKEITVRLGQSITVTEDNYSDYATSYSIKDANGATQSENSVKGNSVTLSQISEDTTIAFTNHKEATPDTGIILDSLPYVLILACVVAVAAFVLIRRRRGREED